MNNYSLTGADQGIGISSIGSSLCHLLFFAILQYVARLALQLAADGLQRRETDGSRLARLEY